MASIAKTIASARTKDGSGTSAAASRKNGEKISDCGSAICGIPAKTCGVQNGDWPLCRAWARKANCGKKCAFASQGMVTRPESQGKASASAQTRKNAAARA